MRRSGTSGVMTRPTPAQRSRRIRRDTPRGAHPVQRIQAMQDFTGSLWTNGHIFDTVAGKIERTIGADGKVMCKGKFVQALNITASVGAKYRLKIRNEP